MSEERPLAQCYNPDILSCLANLSNDEVFTPPAIVNRMLDMLPEKLWSDPDAKFLDPCCKTGVFLREIAKRLIRGLEPKIPDLQARIDHIFHEQLYGIAITEMTALLSRRSVYCSKYPNSRFSVSRFDDVQGNIHYCLSNHVWDDKDKCKICGASKEQFENNKTENHAYEFIHTDRPEEIFKMKFDVIIGNPPYQLNVGVEKENYAVPIYQKFVEQAMKLNPRYLTMIIPSRWYAGGRGLDEFRDKMLHDNRISIIHDFPDASDCFPGVQIKAGVCYFLWDRTHHGFCSITSHAKNIPENTMDRPLLEEGCSTLIRYNNAIAILRKVTSQKSFSSFSELVSPQTPFGIITSYKGLKERESLTDIKMYISGNEKEFKGGSSFAPESKITKGQNMIPWHKVYIGEAGSGSDTFPHSILSVPFYGEPNTVCNQSYLVIGPFPSKKICENVMSYIRTKFFRFMVLQKKNAQHAMRAVYQFVPMQDFSHPWTDEMLYEKYGITAEEQAFIDSMIRPMDANKE